MKESGGMVDARCTSQRARTFNIVQYDVGDAQERRKG